MTSTRHVTDYLRGLAVLFVMGNHYASRYLTDEPTWHANGVIAMFFVLSGYGIFHSLDRAFQKQGSCLRSTLRFYYGRALRIYPLYWLFLLVYAFTHGEVAPIWVWLGIPIQMAPGIAYFVTFLIQCYLIGPFVFLAMRQLGTTIYVALVTGGLVLVWGMGMLAPSTVPYLSVYSYHHMLFSHVFLFALGLALPNLLSLRFQMPARWALLFLSFLVFCATVHFTRFQYFDLSQYIAPLFILSTFAFCYLMILTQPRLPLGKILILLGTYSYSIYLFHLSLYDAFEAIGVVGVGRWTGIIFVILALPAFVLACVLVEKLADRLRKRLEVYAP